MSVIGGGPRRASRLLALALACAGLALGTASPGEALAQDEVDPAAEDAFFTGVALLEAGDASGAIARFDQALRIQKDLRRVFFYRAQAWVRLGDVAEASSDANAYAAFPLSDGERDQLAELRTEIAARAEQVGVATTRPDAPARPPQDGRVSDAGPDGFAHLRAAEEALARGDCAGAGAKAQEALAVDNTLTRAFLVKGLALECEGELTRGRSLISTYQELRGAQAPDPVASAAIERIDKALLGEASDAPVTTGPTWTVLGKDNAIRGVLGQEWGMPQERALEVRTRRQPLPGVGQGDVGQPRMTIGGSNARVERAWLVDQRGLLWTRLRVYERSGMETTDWFVRSFAELYRTLERDSGSPSAVRGIEGSIEDGDGAHSALKGLRTFDATWKDGDGDTIVMRLGRCAAAGDVSRVHPDTAPCLELVAWSGAWTPDAHSRTDKATLAARRVESPGMLAPDLSGGLGVGFGPSFWGLGAGSGVGTAALGGEVGLDVNLRAGFGGFVVGVGWALSLAGFSDFGANDSGPFADNRVMGYIGFRDRPRLRSMTDVMLGAGVVPETGGAAAALSLRILSQVRVADAGRFFVSFEPYVALGSDISIVPIRFSLGFLFGTKARPLGGVQ